MRTHPPSSSSSPIQPQTTLTRLASCAALDRGVHAASVPRHAGPAAVDSLPGSGSSGPSTSTQTPTCCLPLSSAMPPEINPSAHHREPWNAHKEAPHPRTMPLLIRDGTAADLAAITTIFLAAFASEPLIARTHPHAAQYPSHPHLYYRRFFEARFWGPEQQILRVAVDAATDEPVAFAWFRRPWRAADAATRAAHEGPAT
ncbi:hypothetical protein BN1723_003145 [Verticillium longisporum]|uniref:Uncharacterized protein n=1 Tax=Verticillium longisporum TaxID=100787 RepID=A0A0G4LRH0_VERLO|nr:hypothetical protein BN1723_003145 [Verticillium longisporum]